MKTKSLLALALTALILFSCSKERDVDLPVDVNGISLALNVSTEALTRAIEDEANIDAIEINTIIIELYDVNKKIIGIGKSLDAAQIVAVMHPSNNLGDVSRIVIEGVSKEAVYAKIYAYQAASQLAIDLSAGVNKFQDGFNAVPFYTYEGSVASPFDAATGLITINKSAAPAPGPSADAGHESHKIWTVEAKMSAYLARYEVKGAIKVANVIPIDGIAPAKVWATITVTGIYVNNIKEAVTSGVPTLIKGNHQNWGSGDWATGHPYQKADGNWSKMFDVVTGQEVHAVTNTPLFVGASADKVSAFQLFPQGVANAAAYSTDAAPHVIVRMLITPDKTVIDKEPYYAFITLRKFKIYSGTADGTATNNYLNLVERGKVYRVDLSTLAALKPGDIDPDPESAAADLYVKVTIQNWTELYLRPEL